MCFEHSRYKMPKNKNLQKKKRERREKYERKKELEVCKTSVLRVVSTQKLWKLLHAVTF